MRLRRSMGKNHCIPLYIHVQRQFVMGVKKLRVTHGKCFAAFRRLGVRSARSFHSHASLTHIFAFARNCLRSFFYRKSKNVNLPICVRRQKLSSNTTILYIRRHTFSTFLSKKLPEKVYPLMAIVTKKWERYSFFNNQTGFTSVTFQSTIPESGLLGKYFFRGGLRDKYLAGGIGTYTTTAHGGNNSKWTKQPKSAENAPVFSFSEHSPDFSGSFHCSFVMV